MTVIVKEETSDGLRDSRKKLILRPNLTTDHRRSMTNQTPNQDWQILGLGFCTPAEVLSLPKRQFRKSTLVFISFQVTWFDSWGWLHCVEDEDNVICHKRYRSVKSKTTRFRNSFYLEAIRYMNGEGGCLLNEPV